MSGVATPEDLLNQAPFARVVRHLRELLREGGRAGEYLPSERKLSEKLGVGRTTVRRALAILCEEGVIERRGIRARRVAPVHAATSPNGTTTSWLVSKSIAVIVPPQHNTDDAALSAQWLRYTSLGVFDAIRDAGRHSIGFNARDHNQASARRIAAEKPMGVIIPEIDGNDVAHVDCADVFVDRGVPVVLYGDHPRLASFDRVMSDHESGGYTITKRFLQQGLKRIVMICPPPLDRYWLAARHRGYSRAMTEAGLSPQPIHACVDIHGPGYLDRPLFELRARSVVGHLIELLTGPDAAEVLLAPSDRFVPYLAFASRLLGRTGKTRVRFAGYDNYYTLCEEQKFEPTWPEVTVDKQNNAAGAAAVQLLLRRVAGELPAGTPTVVKLEPRVIDVSKDAAEASAMYVRGVG